MKAYVKPELFFESFELSQTVATCNFKVSLTDETKCTILEDRVNGGTLKGAFASLDACGWLCEMFCYTNSSNTVSTFQS